MRQERECGGHPDLKSPCHLHASVEPHRAGVGRRRHAISEPARGRQGALRARADRHPGRYGCRPSVWDRFNKSGASGPDAAIAELRSLVGRITADVPDATVLVASLVVSTNGSEEQWRGTYNQAIPRIVGDAQAAGKRVAYVDMSGLTTADLADPLHPNDSGYRKMADAFHRGVQAADSAGWLRNPAPAPARVQSGIAGKCLDVSGAGTADGTAVQTWSCGDGTNQYWSAYTDGTLRSLGKCLDAAGRGTTNGTKVDLWACHGGTNQVWQPYNGGYRNPASGRCLDVPGSSTADGTQLQLWDCHGGANQKWTTLTAG
ncbi:ricin-type beta-trefoil lectin domain protein [Streptomyces sp. NPDC058955]|uniref:ricin-type beta-trefoil lectin domain protein n=1 Tax=unclassified Streptomyces TaxID=2593676 RepID=UPI0036599D07